MLMVLNATGDHCNRLSEMHRADEMACDTIETVWLAVDRLGLVCEVMNVLESACVK